MQLLQKNKIRSGDIVYFLHVPRTGGKVFYRYIADHFPDSARCALDYHVSSQEQFDAIPEDVSSCRVIRAYFDYNFHRYLSRKPLYVTMLRHPVERILSLYDCIKVDTTHPLHSLAASLDLESFVRHPDCQIEVDNVQTRRLAGHMFHQDSDLDEGLILELAKVNLEEMAFFGIIERFLLSLKLMHHTFGWAFPDDPYVHTKHVRIERYSAHDISPDELKAIEDKTNLDRDLYTFAKQLFEMRHALMIQTAVMMQQTQNSAAHLPVPLNELLDSYYKLRILEKSWAWRVANRLRGWRERIAPPGSRREELYQRIGKFLIGD